VYWGRVSVFSGVIGGSGYLKRLGYGYGDGGASRIRKKARVKAAQHEG